MCLLYVSILIISRIFAFRARKCHSLLGNVGKSALMLPTVAQQVRLFLEAIGSESDWLLRGRRNNNKLINEGAPAGLRSVCLQVGWDRSRYWWHKMAEVDIVIRFELMRLTLYSGFPDWH